MMKSLVRLLLVGVLAVLSALPASARGYKIQPGDMLQLEVLEDSTLNRTLLVLPDGTINVPMAGTMQAAGNTVDAVRGTITQKLAPSFSTSPTVYLSVSQLAAPETNDTKETIPVYALGEVLKPGKLDVEPGTTLLQALAESGGLTPYAATKRIQLRRTGSNGVQQVYRYDYKAVLTGKSVRTIVLEPGDVVMVPTRRLFE